LASTYEPGPHRNAIKKMPNEPIASGAIPHV
jgi:hypothetical protein